jgi:flagellar motor switch protein FliN/FliY
MQLTEPSLDASVAAAKTSSGTNESADTPAAVQIIHLSEMHDTQSNAGAAIMESINPLHQVKARLQVCVGEVTMTVGEILNAKEHQIVTLDRQVDQPIDLLLEGKVIARGQLVATGDHFAVRITELPVPLKT